MKPAPFTYHAPDTRAEVLSLLARYGPEARLLAGGQSLVPAMNFRLVKPAVIIDLNRVADLTGVTAADGEIAVGSMTRQRELERSPLVRERLVALSEALPNVGFPQTRSRGTLGGSLAHADPAAELPAVAVAYGARLRLASERGERWIAAADFLTDPYTNALQPDELLVEIVFPPLAPGTGAAFAEVNRRQSHRAEAGAISIVQLSGDGTLRECTLTLFAVGRAPIAVTSVNAMLQGSVLTPQSVAWAVAALEVDPISDQYATASYRRHLCQVLARTTLSRALERARSSTDSPPA